MIYSNHNAYVCPTQESKLIAKRKHSQSVAKTLAFGLGGFTTFGLIIAIMLRGKNIAVLNSKGFIASEQRSIMLYALVIILTIAVPTVLLLYFVAWRYRESNAKSTYHSEAKRGKLFVFSIWALPTTFMLVLAMILVPITHKLEPNKAIASGVKPITIQVMAMRWKWLFIYPDQQIATVNFVQIPKGVPVIFDLSADDAPMSSFWVPNLGGQLYAMTGHINHLNLIADKMGDYQGRSAEINGAGFEGMRFTTRVSTKEDFGTWAQGIRASSASLDTAAYNGLLTPTKNNQTTSYVAYDSSIYGRAVMKYMGSHSHMMMEEGGH
jgi:cytochrome o ubiquinol oxidase subunit 2